MSQSNPTDLEVEIYSGHYVLHGVKSDAFRHTFPNTKVTDKTINEKASRLHKLDKVLTRIDKITDRVKEIAAKEFKIDAAYVLERSNELLSRCMVEGEGFNATGAGKAIDLIGKHVAVQAFKDNVDINAKVKVEKSFNDFYDKD